MPASLAGRCLQVCVGLGVAGVAGYPRSAAQIVEPDPKNLLNLRPVAKGLDLLRSSALRERPLRIISVTGQARKGKSFFLNSLIKETVGGPFQVSSSQEGVTKGLWMHVIGNDGEPRPGGAVDTDAFATVLMDTEGIGAPESTEESDTKLVALGGMLASTMFYNNMKDVNQDDVRVLYSMIEFDKFFKQERQRELVWLVQSYSKDPDVWPCHKYPDVFLKEQPRGSETTFTEEQRERHRKVVRHVRARGTRIFCMAYPKKSPFVEDYRLPSVPYEELDEEYKRELSKIRSFLFSRSPSDTSTMLKGREVADFLEVMIPRLNEINVALSEFVSFHAEKCRKDLEARAEAGLDAVVADFNCRFKPEDFYGRCDDIGRNTQLEFGACTLGDASMRENRKVEAELTNILRFQIELHKKEIRAMWDKCQPHWLFVTVRDYFVGHYFLCLDLVMPYVFGKASSWILYCLPGPASCMLRPIFGGTILLVPLAFTSTREIFVVLALIEYGPALGLPDLKAMMLGLTSSLVDGAGIGWMHSVFPSGQALLDGAAGWAESHWRAWVTPWCSPVLRMIHGPDALPRTLVVGMVVLAGLPRLFQWITSLRRVELMATAVFILVECLAERSAILSDWFLLVATIVGSGVVLFLPFAAEPSDCHEEADEDDEDDGDDEQEPAADSVPTASVSASDNSGNGEISCNAWDGMVQEELHRILLWVWIIGSAVLVLVYLGNLWYRPRTIPNFFDMDVVSCAGVVWGATVDSADSMACVLCEPSSTALGPLKRLKGLGGGVALGTLATAMYCIISQMGGCQYF
mmetsp:Transcript_56787/g.158118  ORF Transcript_56787/g.158118 Transcript_56787/m.158118 type:complete len:804 (+) Transcript_56787:78-2489(+)